MDGKSIKAFETLINTNAATRYKAGTPFVCMTADLLKTIMVTKEPETDETGGSGGLEAHETLGTTLEVTQTVLQIMTGKGIEGRPIPDHIKAKMVAEGKTPSPAAADLLLIVITASATDVVVGLNIPESVVPLISEEQCQIFGGPSVQVRCNGPRFVYLYSQPYPSPFVAKDYVLRMAFNLLKQCGIYKEEPDDEEVLDYTINDL